MTREVSLIDHFIVIISSWSINLYSNVTDSPTAAGIAAEKMTVLAKGVKEILSAFASAKFVASFTVDEEDIADKIFAESSFIEVHRIKSLKLVLLVGWQGLFCLIHFSQYTTAIYYHFFSFIYFLFFYFFLYRDYRSTFNLLLWGP